MAIDEKEMLLEKNKLDKTKAWIEKEIGKINKNNEELQNKIAGLKKQAKGKYDEELETTQSLYEITSKNLEKYNESISQPYFARIDFREYRRDVENYYIGKFGLGDSSTGDEVVIDWRAPIADLYYSGTQGKVYYEAPMGIINGDLHLKRKFLIRKGNLENAFDEGINEIILKSSVDDNGDNALVDEFLKINLEESLSSKLKDVVATIQKEQNEIIRADKNCALIVQGSAGSGKTTVALHRLAYLLYKYKNRIQGEDILVVAPNRLFLDYISEVLPNLGVDKVRQKTFEDIAVEILGIKKKVYTKDKKLSSILEGEMEENLKILTNISKLKGSKVFKVIMDRYVRYIEKRDINVEDIKVDDYVLFESKEIKRLYARDMQNFPINKRKDEIKRYFNLKLGDKIKNILDKIDFSYEYLVARVKKTMEDGLERRKKLTELYDERDSKKKQIKHKALENFKEYFKNWKHGDIDNIYYDFYNNKQVFEEITEGKIPEVLYNNILQQINLDEQNKVIDSDELAAMLYLKFKIDGVPEKNKYKHIVVDEAQDYSILQILVLKIMAINDSFTIVGDVGQGIYYYKGIDSWDKVVKDVFDENATYTALTQSYRSTIEIINLANKVLEKQMNKLTPAKPVLRHGRKPDIIQYDTPKEFALKLDEIVQNVHNRGKNSIAIIGKTFKECKDIKASLKKYSKYDWELVKDTDKLLKMESIIIPSYMTKGLEFDCTVIYNCDDINYGDSEINKRILYVALTRALHEEYIFYKDNKSSLID